MPRERTAAQGTASPACRARYEPLVSALLSPHGPPRRLLDDAKTLVFELCSSPVLMAELLDVMSREKFARRISQAGLTPQGIAGDIRRLATLVAPASVP